MYVIVYHNLPSIKYQMVSLIYSFSKIINVYQGNMHLLTIN